MHSSEPDLTDDAGAMDRSSPLCASADDAEAMDRSSPLCAWPILLNVTCIYIYISDTAKCENGVCIYSEEC